ncbi:MAG: hypothetical protein QOG84_117 [Sphingomonadales bacterium]|jgi:hypothetical protein|nr:hypothetical protein [Sphingomonadales bacterium]
MKATTLTPSRPPAAPINEDLRAVYEQDGEFVRHHRGVKWGRFQLVSVIEGAALYTSFQASGLNRLETVALMAAATMVIGFIFVLAIVDSRAILSHVSRMRAYEAQNGISYSDPNRRPLFGFRTSRLAMSTIVLFNLLVMIRLGGWGGA